MKGTTRGPSPEIIASAREFNRFYTRLIGVLNRGFLETEYSLTEVRILFELRHRERASASQLRQELGIDAGYLSRILAGFGRRRMIRKVAHAADRRQSILLLTERGRRIFDTIEKRQRDAVASTLAALAPSSQAQVVRAMQTIQHLLDEQSEPRVPYLIRAPRPGDIAWIVHRQARTCYEECGWNEKFEGEAVEIAARFIHNADTKFEQCWIVERESEIVGGLFCISESKTIAALRLLFVEPSVRRLGIGTRLLNEGIEFARRAGYKKLRLSTHDALDASRRIYMRAGFRMAKEYRHHRFGRDLLVQDWEKDLTTRR